MLSAAVFDERGLLPAIAQEARSGVVRMLAWANADAIRATAESGYATFFSRSRGELWQKGATSGNVLRVREVRMDCDGDAVLYLVDAEGRSCHMGRTSCFFRPVAGPSVEEDDGPAGIPAAIVSQVAEVIEARRARAPQESYVASLLHDGWAKIA